MQRGPVLIIDGSKYSPKITLDPLNNVYEISGWSNLEMPLNVYEPVLQWLQHYGEQFLNGAVFRFKITYFNSPSAKIFMKIFQMLDVLNKKSDIRFSVEWYYLDETDKMDFTQTFAGLIDIPIQLIHWKK